MKSRFFYLSLVMLMTANLPALAQMDPSSAILLRSGGRTPTKGEYESSRYSIRPGAVKKTEVKSENVLIQTQQTIIHDKPAAQEDLREPSKANDKAVQKIEITEPEHISGEAPEVKPEAPKAAEGEKDILQDLRQVFLGGSAEEVDNYLGKVEASDPRNNMIEFSVAPLIFYNDSNSTYGFRDYYSYGPGLNLNAKFWLSPFFGVSTMYQTSFNAEVRNSSIDNSTEPVEHQWFGAELQFRSFFGVTRKAPSLTFGLGFNEYQMKAKSDSTTRIGMKTSGLKLSLESMIPATRGTAWTMGLELAPRATHQEMKTQISPKSGKHDATNMVGFSVGKKYTFSRSQVLFWKLQHNFEKNAFKKQASEVDASGRQPSNVSVTNTRTMFLFGFTWGN